MKAIMWYIIIINVIGFIIMGLDKKRARRKQYRISEKTLFGCAALGGSLGTTIGIHFFRHKTKHWYFVWGMPGILLVQIIMVIALIC